MEKTQKTLPGGEEQMLLLVNRVKDYAVFLLDPQGAVVGWNSGAEAILGYGKSEILGRSSSILFPPDEAPGIPALLSAARERGGCHEEAWRIRKDGSRFWVDETVTPVFGGGDELLGFGVVLRDMTERKKVEDSLRSAVNARDTFLLIANHELRTPVTALQLQADSLIRRKSELPAWLAEKVEFFQRSLRRLTRLLDEVLDVQRLSAGALRLEIEIVDLAALVREVAEGFAEQAKGVGTSIELRTDEEVSGMWDRTRLGQVVTNLLSNALKFSRGGLVEVTVDGGEAEARLMVRDCGVGIAEEDQERIFEPFERASSIRSFGGLGLGLWISRQAVEAMNGTIRVKSHVGDGATFLVELPRWAQTDAHAVSRALPAG